jgi:predicted acylesterase/phospholipase RssA
VIQALKEAGQPVDYIGGASMGAFIGACWARGIEPEQLNEYGPRMANSSYLLDRTLPYSSVMTSRKLTTALQELFGERQIEDLWRPFFCVSTNLSNAAPVIHELGTLYKAVRASMAMPGIFTPILNENNEMLVDGGVMNNFPVDIMATRAEFDLIIGSNVSPRQDKPSNYDFGESISGWEVLWSRINPFSEPMRVPTLAGIILRTVEVNSLYHRNKVERFADILIKPDVTDFSFLDFASYQTMVHRGYEAGKAAIAAWRETRA